LIEAAAVHKDRMQEAGSREPGARSKSSRNRVRASDDGAKRQRKGSAKFLQ
jgi:hypothetical protein